MSPRVALVCADPGIPWLGCGGASSHLRGLAAGYVQAGATVQAWVARLAPHPGRASALSPPGVHVRQGPSSGFGSWIRARVAAFDPDLVHQRHALQDIGPLPGRRLVEVNAPLTWEGALFRGRRARRSDLDRELGAIRHATAVLVVSAPLQRWLASHGVSSHVVPNGVPARAPSRPPDDGPFVLGFEGSFKAWHGLLESAPSLEGLAASLAPRALTVELVGDGPLRSAVQAALPAARWLGELDPAGLAAARRRWHAVWSPAAPWPPPGPMARLQERLGEPLPDRWFDPLKEAEAAAAGLPVWRSGPELEPPAPPPHTWAEVAARLLAPLAGDVELWNDGTPP